MDKNIASELIKHYSKDIEPSFPLIQEFFNEGEKIFGGLYNRSAGEYYDEDASSKPKPKINEKFSALTLSQDPSKYYFVFYDDRRDESFNKEIRGRSACLSTQPNKYSSNDRLRELIYSEENNGFFVTISENINNRAFIEATDIVQSNGGATAKYKLMDSTKKLTEFKANRMDEIALTIEGQLQPVRWARSIRVDNLNQHTKYNELFIINRSKQPEQERRVHVLYELEGSLENPQKIVISVGLGAPDSAKILFHDSEKSLTIRVFKAHEQELEVLQEDPKFSFLFEPNPDSKQILNLIRDKINLLTQHWDQPQSIFTVPNQLDKTSDNNYQAL